MRVKRGKRASSQRGDKPMRGWFGIDSDQFIPNPPGFEFPWSVAALCGAVILAIVLLAMVVAYLGG